MAVPIPASNAAPARLPCGNSTFSGRVQAATASSIERNWSAMEMATELSREARIYSKIVGTLMVVLLAYGLMTMFGLVR